MNQPVRCGVVDFLNALPLWHVLRDDASFELIPARPSRLAEMLAAGELDLGLLPVIEYFRNPDTLIVPGIGVAADGPVQSVRLFHRTPIESVRTVRLDAASRTSAVLARIILRDAYRLEPEFVIGEVAADGMESLPENAALLIGDPALAASRESELPSLDLGDEWKKLTGLPFVFAAWLVRSAVSDGGLVRSLQEAAATGNAMIPEIAAKEASKHGMEVADAVEYLTSTIRHRLGEPEILGLAEFAKRASALGQCEFREIRFVDGR